MFVSYPQHTSVLCKACKQRRIFVVSPVNVFVRSERRYLILKCLSPACAGISKYEQDELEYANP